MSDSDIWGAFDTDDDPLRGDDQPTAAAGANPGEVTATDRDHQVSVRLSNGRLVSLDIEPSALGLPQLSDCVMDAVNAALAKSDGDAANAQVWQDRLNELELIQIRADATITSAIDATQTLTRNTERILGEIRPPAPFR